MQEGKMYVTLACRHSPQPETESIKLGPFERVWLTVYEVYGDGTRLAAIHESDLGWYLDGRLEDRDPNWKRAGVYAWLEITNE